MPATKEIDDFDATKLLNQAMETPALAGYLAHADSLAVAPIASAEAQRTASTRSKGNPGAATAGRSDRSPVGRGQGRAGGAAQDPGVRRPGDHRRREATPARSVAQIAGGGQTAQDQQTIARINALGELATVADKMRAKQLEFNNANRQGLGIHGRSRPRCCG